MSKYYSFLKEDINPLAVTAGAVGTAAMIGGAGAIMPAMAVAGLGMGALGTVKNIRQNNFNSKYLDLMYRELGACGSRQQALEIVNRYSTKLTSMYNKVDKKLISKNQIMQTFINTNFRIPLIRIINNPQDPNWKANALTFFKKNRHKINIKNNVGALTTATSLAAGGALMSGLGGATAATIATSSFWVNAAVRQLKTFNITRYLNKMKIEIQNCPDDNRQFAQQILEKYCYDISNNIQTIANKSGKKINFNVQQQLRARFLTPCLQIINNPQNKYWKVTLIDYIDSEKIQGVVQSVCDAISQLIIPRFLRRNLK